MAGDTIFAFAIFSQQFCNCSKSHLTLTHSSVGMARSWDFKDKLMSLDPLQGGGSCSTESKWSGLSKSVAKTGTVPVEIIIPN